MLRLASALVLLAVIIPLRAAEAQSCDPTSARPCNLEGGQSASPSTGAAVEDDISALTLHARQQAKALPLEPLPAGSAPPAYIQLTIGGVCGTGLETAARDFLAKAARGLVVEQRAVAVSLTLSQAGSKPLTLPLIVMKSAADGGGVDFDCAPELKALFSPSVPIIAAINLSTSKGKFSLNPAVAGVIAFATQFIAATSTANIFAAADALVWTTMLGKADIIRQQSDLALALPGRTTQDAAKLALGAGGTSIPIGGGAFTIQKSQRVSAFFTGASWSPWTPDNWQARMPEIVGKPFGEWMATVRPRLVNFMKADKAGRAAICRAFRDDLANLAEVDRWFLIYMSFKSELLGSPDVVPGATCFTDDVQKLLKQIGLTEEPYPDAFRTQSAPATPSGGADFAKDVDPFLTYHFGPQLVNIGSLASAYAPLQPTDRAKAVDSAVPRMTYVFAPQVDVSDAAGLLLKSASAPFYSNEDVVRLLFDAPPVSRFGCHRPVNDPDLKQQGIVAEVLFAIDSKPAPALANAFVGTVKGQAQLAVRKLVLQKPTATTRADIAKAFPSGCGDGSWKPF